MADEAQVTGVAPEQSGGPAPAQPIGPSTEAAGVAAGTAATTQATAVAEDPLAKFKERLSRQQSILDRKAAEAARLADTERQRAEALQAQLDTERMKSMTEADRARFLAGKQQEQFEAQRQAVLQERAAVEEDKVYLQWYSWFLSQGVPAEKLAQCQDFPQMQEAFAEHMRGLAAAPAQEPRSPTVGPADKVHTGGFGAPPSREFDRLIAEGHGPGTKKYREYLNKIKRSGATELI